MFNFNKIKFNKSFTLNMVTRISSPLITGPLITSPLITSPLITSPIVSSPLIIRDLELTPFTKTENIESFYLFQEELKKDKFFIGRLSGNETLFT